MSKKPRPKTKPQMKKLVEEIVLTEEDEKILDQVWREIRRELDRKRRQNRGKSARLILKLSSENLQFRRALAHELRRQ